MTARMTRPFEPVAIQWPETPDSFAEVTMEIDSSGREVSGYRPWGSPLRSRIVATVVMGPGVDGSVMLAHLIGELWRRC